MSVHARLKCTLSPRNPKLRALKAAGTMGSLAARAAVAGPIHGAEAALAADLGLEAGKELTMADYEEWLLRKMRRGRNPHPQGLILKEWILRKEL